MSATSPDPQPLYSARFFVVFAILFTFMAAFSMLVHLPKYVVALGGDISTVGNIFGFGMLGSLLARPFVGRWIDRAGCRIVLLVATLGAAVAIAVLPWAAHLGMIFLLRMVLQLTQAALLAAVAVLAAHIAPPGRSAESLAMLGIGGLTGLMLGPMIGELIFPAGDATHATFVVFFTTSAAIMLGATALAALAPNAMAALASNENTALASNSRAALAPGEAAAPTIDTTAPSMLRLVVAHWPGPILVVALCLAFVQTMPIVFIERFVAARGLGGVTLFFAAYAPTAIILRVALRRLPARLGRRRTLLFGMACYVVGLLLLIPVRSDLGLLLPAIVAGIGHCFSYPFLVDLAAERMPAAHRGIATAVALGALDVGFLLGFLIEGALIEQYGFNLTLVVVAATCAAGVTYYAWTQRRSLQADAATA